jgi:hypothetical protein
MRVLVCGGRGYANYRYLYGFLDCYHATVCITHLIQGGASGADFHALQWANMRNIQSTTFKADWEKHGKKAGPLRNREMLDVGKPDVIIAFPGHNGTADMVNYARSKNYHVIRAEG